MRTGPVEKRAMIRHKFVHNRIVIIVPVDAQLYFDVVFTRYETKLRISFGACSAFVDSTKSA